MKTSNKILIGTAFCLILGLFLYSFLLRGAYQKAIANPATRMVKIDLKEPKYLDIKHHWNVNFKHGTKFQIQLYREYKDLFHYKYIGDSLNLDAIEAGEITIITPKLPIMKFNSEKGSALLVYIGKSFAASNIDATFLKSCIFICEGNNFEFVNIKSKEALKIEITACQIKNLQVNLPKHSELSVNYSNINHKILNLADSCSVNITGNYRNDVVSGKYYGTTW